MSANALFLRLEGPLQSWGTQESKFVVRRSAGAPTKSGVAGLLCAALGVGRREAAEEWLPRLSALRMGVRADAPGVRWWDYHTVGAGMQMRIAEGEEKTKPGAMLTRREYLCDASFLVALTGEAGLVEELAAALGAPRWPLYLGRKCCPPSRPVLECAPGRFAGPLEALCSVPWRPRLRGDARPATVECLLDWTPAPEEREAPGEAEVWYDVPASFEPPAHGPRFVVRRELKVGPGGELAASETPTQSETPRPRRPRADYTNTEYRKRRAERLKRDNHQCVFCKTPIEGRGATVQHVTYRRAGGEEREEDLRTLCRLCHDAVTMIEYGLEMGLDRIDPELPEWRERIIAKREEIIRFRSLATRRRHLQHEEV